MFQTYQGTYNEDKHYTGVETDSQNRVDGVARDDALEGYEHVDTH